MVDRALRLTWRKVLLIVIAWVVCVVMHNVVYALFYDFFGPKGDEPFFFLLAVIVIPLYFVASLGYTVIQWTRPK